MHKGSCLCGAVRFEIAGDLMAPDAYTMPNSLVRRILRKANVLPAGTDEHAS